MQLQPGTPDGSSWLQTSGLRTTVEMNALILINLLYTPPPESYGRENQKLWQNSHLVHFLDQKIFSIVIHCSGIKKNRRLPSVYPSAWRLHRAQNETMCTVQLALALNSAGWEYDNALKEFKYIHPGPGFGGTERARCQIRLACQALRLSRWGVATGVHGPLASGNGLIELRGWGDVEDLEEAQEGLESIIEVFEEYRAKGTVREEQQQEGLRRSVSAEPDERSLLDRMHSLTGARHGPGSPGRERGEWVLIEREDFDGLLLAVRKLVTDLIEPWERWYRGRMQELCQEEAEVLVRENAVSLLVEIASEEDPDLARALDGVGKKAVSLMPQHLLFP